MSNNVFTQGLVISRSGSAMGENQKENHSTGKKTDEDKLDTGTWGNMEKEIKISDNFVVPRCVEPYSPSGDISLNMESTNGMYKTRDDINEDFQRMEKFGHVHRSGSYVFDHCKKCLGPMFGHIAKEAECTHEEYTTEMVETIEMEIENNLFFPVGLARIDKRSVVKKCDVCDNEFETSLETINHKKNDHGVTSGETKSKMDDAIATMAKVVEQLAKKSTENDKKPIEEKRATQEDQ